MFNLITISEQKKLYILSVFFKKEYIFKKNLTKDLNNSAITTRRLIIELNDDLNKLQKKSSIKIDTSTSNIYFIKHHSNIYLNDLYFNLIYFYLSNSSNFIFLSSLLKISQTRSKKSLQDIADEQMFSPIYFYKKKKNINEDLSNNNYNFQLEMKNVTFELSGSIIEIRFFLFHLYWQTRNGLDWPFLVITYKECSSLATKDPRVFQDNSNKLRFNYLIAIIITHLEMKKEIPYLNILFEQALLIYYEVNDCVQQLILPSKKWNLKKKMNFNELLFFNLIARLTLSKIDSFEEKCTIGMKLMQLDSELTKIVFSYLIYIENQFNYSFDSFSLYMYNGVLFLLSQIYSKSETHNNIFNIRQKPNKSILSNIRFCRIIKKFFHNNIPTSYSKFFDECTQDNIIYWTFHIIESEKKPLQIYIQYSSCMFTEQYISKVISSIFNKKTIRITSKINKSDIIISDSFEKNYEKPFYLLTTDINLPEISSFIHQQISETHILNL